MFPLSRIAVDWIITKESKYKYSITKQNGKIQVPREYISNPLFLILCIISNKFVLELFMDLTVTLDQEQ